MLCLRSIDCSRASAGGQLEQPSEVNNSTSTGCFVSACAARALPARFTPTTPANTAATASRTHRKTPSFFMRNLTHPVGFGLNREVTTRRTGPQVLQISGLTTATALWDCGAELFRRLYGNSVVDHRRPDRRLAYRQDHERERLRRAHGYRCRDHRGGDRGLHYALSGLCRVGRHDLHHRGRRAGRDSSHAYHPVIYARASLAGSYALTRAISGSAERPARQRRPPDCHPGLPDETSSS